jgi:ABC-type transport system involved in multi-copper enzyme maturation permease subunit
MLTIALFELRNRLRLLSTWVYFALFAILAGLFVAAAGGMFLDFHVVLGAGRVKVNSPFAIASTYSFFAIVGISVISAIMGRAVQQDFEHRTHALLFSTPLSRRAYLGGRYLGAAATVALVFLSVGLGMWITTYLPGMDAERIGPNRVAAYLIPYLTILVPDILIIGGVFFALAAVSRRMLPVYVGSVVVLLGWLASAQLMKDLQNQNLAALIDPFGMRALISLVRYWSVAQRDAQLIPLSGVLLWNRVLWCCVAGAIWLLAARAFSFREPVEMRERKPGPATRATARVLRLPHIQAMPRSWSAQAGLLASMTWMYFREIVTNVYFGVLIFAALGTLVVTSSSVFDIYGTTTWPVTALMLDLDNGLYAIFILALITFYAGELVWREREDRIDQIVDTTQLPVGTSMASKVLALALVPVVSQLLLIGFCVCWQMAHGYWHFQPGLYAHTFLGITLIDYWQLVILAFAVQSVVNHKYIGHLIMVLYYLFINFAPSLGFEELLYRFGESLLQPYSDMNGFGAALWRTRVLQAYWSSAAVLLLVLAYLMWPRGTSLDWRTRLATARARVTPWVIGWAVAGGSAFIGFGGYIFYNTHVLNAYVTEHDRNAWRAAYEVRYKPLAALPEPKVVAVKLAVDLFPSEQRVRMHGTLQIENRSAVPVDTLILGIQPSMSLAIDQLPSIEVHQLALDVAATVEEDARFRVWRYHLAQALAPGGQANVQFDLELPTRGFANSSINTLVVGNGSFVHGADLIPRIGYARDQEIKADDERRKYDLPAWGHWPARDDVAALANNLIAGPDADWIHYDATVSTDLRQSAIAPGDLVDEHEADGRRFSHYRIDAPIQDIYGFQSARYALQRSAWGDTAGARTVPIDIYYQAGHTFDLEAMNRSVQESLDYFTQKFGPYQFDRFRIVEFPRYQTFAEAMPNTTPFSEAIGFVARVDPKDDKDIDYPYYVTAHEVAHQWWGHQVISADTQGGTMITETLAQYSALMVMKHHFGAARMRRFLSYELDAYLVGRSIAKLPELPLARVEDQDYIHYRKGALAMYALQDYIGEDKVDAVLRTFRERHAFKGPPYPTSAELVQMFHDAAPVQLQYLVDDLFNRIVLYDNHAEAARARALPGGRYEVTMSVDVHKYELDGDGHEKPMALDDDIDIGVLDERGDAIAVRREHIRTEKSRFSIIVDRRPASAGIDPLEMLITRHPHENTVPVDLS